MTAILHRKLLVVLAIAIASPTAALAQPATTVRSAGDAPGAALTAQEREVLAAAEQLAAEAEQLIERWITTPEISEAQVFARLYFPIAGTDTDPQRYGTPYDKLADRDVVGLGNKVLARSPGLLYAILTDVNGYVPVDNTRLATPDIKDRTKRMLGDPASLLAARNEAHYLIQRTKLRTGDVIYDLSVPIAVRGKHWGCVRIGYRPDGT